VPLTLDEALTPTDWSAGTQLLDKTDVTGSPNGLGYPTVIKADGRISSPLDAWYMWMSPHDNAVIYLATAPEPAGPWTVRNSGDPVIDTPPTGATDIAAPFVTWNPDTSELWMWAHGQMFGGDFDQPTFFYKSTDGVSWTIQNSGSPVLLTANNGSGARFAQTASYLTAVRQDGKFRAFFQGVAHGATTADVIGAQSSDGVVWSVLGDGGNGMRAFASADSGYDAGRPVPLLIAGRLSVFYSGVNSTPATVNRVRQFLGDATWSAAFDSGIPLGANGTWDDFKAVASDFVYHDGKVWCFYTGDGTGADTADEAIGVMSCTFASTGFDTSWGKG